MSRTSLFRLKLAVAARAILHILGQWRYTLLAAVLAFGFLILLFWLLNLELLWYILSSQYLAFGEKVSFVLRSTVGYLTDMPPLQALATLLLVIGQGIVFTILVYIAKTQRKLDPKALGGSTIASIIALFSVGCVSCGTSIVAPVIGLFFSGATASLSETINSVAIYVSLAIVTYALYAVGSTASTFIAKERFATPEKTQSASSK